MKKKLRILSVILLGVLLSINLLSCNWSETKENVQEGVDKFNNAVEKNEPANKFINGVLGGKKK